MAQDKDAASAVEELGISRKLRALREKRRFTLEDLAAKTGLSKSLLADIEAGEFVPPVATLLNLGRALGVGMAHFFKDEAPGGARGGVCPPRQGEDPSQDERDRTRPRHRPGPDPPAEH